MSSIRTGWLMVFVWLLVPAAARGGEPETELFALVIGCNSSVDADVAPLHYADDDAVQNAQLMNQLGAEVILLTELDRQTRSLYPPLRTTLPTHAALRAAADRLNARMQAVRRRGGQPVLYLFYSGHGDVENNRGFVNLHGEKLWRDELLELLGNSAAATKHLVIDACKSYFAVFDRGTGGARHPLRHRLLGDQRGLPDDTGVLLSTSSAADSHEWEAVQAGVFSHELRSALRGAADLDLDGRLTYEETAAFVWTANAAIANPRYRPAFFSRPPRRAVDVLVDLHAARADRLHVAAGTAAHLFIEDQLGRRLVDFHPSPDQALVLRIPSIRPLFVRSSGGEAEYELPAGSDVRFDALAMRPSSARRRGAEHLAFRRLFARPFGQQALADFRNRPPDVAVDAPEPIDWTWVRRGLGISAAAMAVAGGALTGLALGEKSAVDERTSGLERSRINARIERFNTAAVTCYALAGTALAAYLVWTLWPDEEVELSVMPADGAQLQMKLRF